MARQTRRAFLKTSFAATGAVAGLGASQNAPANEAAGHEEPREPSAETFRLTRPIPVETGYDLVVAGGGPAGTAAVQSIRRGQPAGELDTEQLVQTLRQAGAYLPQKDLSRKMTRS